MKTASDQASFVDLRHLTAAAVAAALAAMAPPALAQYSFRELDTGGFSTSQVRDVANGMAVGYGIVPGDNAQQLAIAWPVNGGPRIDLSHGFRSEALGIDNSWAIAGSVYFRTVILSDAGFWPSPSAAPQDFSGELGYSSALATQDGRVVGWGRRLQGPNPINDSAFVWGQTSTDRTQLVNPSGAAAGYGRNIDDNWIVGEASVVTGGGYPGAAAWDVADPDHVRALNLHPTGFDYSTTSAVDQARAVGLTRRGADDPSHAYLWDLNGGTARDLHALIPPSFGAVASSATDLRGDLVIGAAADASGNLFGVAWNLATQQAIDLRKFLPSNVNFSSATAINDDGQIVGDFRTPANDHGVYVLTPDRTTGDADGDRVVTFDDYVRIDTGFNNHVNGWSNGDFNYSGRIDFDDYVLIDLAFNRQNGTLARAVDWIKGDDRSGAGVAGVDVVIDHLDQFGLAYGQAFLAAVPEPAHALTLVGITGALSRRWRGNRRAVANTMSR